MGRRKVGKFKSKPGEESPKSKASFPAKPMEGLELVRHERYFEIFVATALFAFGVYQSVLYFGYKIVPTVDFPGFVRVGRELLSFKVPSDFKRAPVLGLLLVCLSHVVGGQHPDLTAGWLLNAVLHPFNLLLFWVAAKRVVGKSAPWFAVIAILNPGVMRMLTDPVVETTLLFFTLLTFYFIFKRSNWSYLFASITTMVRYEGAALIMAAFVMDLIYSTSRRERIRAFAYSVAASVPLAVWLLGTALTWSSVSKGHYLEVFWNESYYSKLLSTPYESNVGFIINMKALWQMGFYPLLMPHPNAGRDFVEVFWGMSKFIAAAGFFFGSIYGLFKRRWNIPALLIFFVPYLWVHAQYPYPMHRYYTNIFWIALLICLYGLQSTWQVINKNQRVPVAVVTALQILILIVAGVWLFGLLPYLPAVSEMSPKSASVPYVTVGLVGLLLGVQAFVFRPRYLFQNPVRDVLQQVVILMVLALVVVSNQFVLVRLLRDGREDVEFKLLADWYVANARPGEKLLTTLPTIVGLYAPQYKDFLISVGIIGAENEADFIKKCFEEDITYVAWDSRIGSYPANENYKFWGMKNIAQLANPQSIGPYELLTQISNKNRFINVFRLRRPAEVVEQKGAG